MEKRTLIAALRAKGGPQERRYALLLQRHTRFREALGRIAGQSILDRGASHRSGLGKNQR